MSMKKVKPIIHKNEPVIVIFPDAEGMYLAQTRLDERETAMILSNLALNFAIQAGEKQAYAESENKIISPLDGKKIIQNNRN